ncbi:MAG: hypothetical protein QMD99_20185 [Rhizobiaceae bacterium]|nr:hypothetical protein [Rhizobiaceae bacterium]
MSDPSEMIAWLDGRIASTKTWLETHGPGTKRPWPQMDIEDKETNLARYEEIRVAYVKALERRNAG